MSKPASYYGFLTPGCRALMRALNAYHRHGKGSTQWFNALHIAQHGDWTKCAETVREMAEAGDERAQELMRLITIERLKA